MKFKQIYRWSLEITCIILCAFSTSILIWSQARVSAADIAITEAVNRASMFESHATEIRGLAESLLKENKFIRQQLWLVRSKVDKKHRSLVSKMVRSRSKITLAQIKGEKNGKVRNNKKRPTRSSKRNRKNPRAK